MRLLWTTFALLLACLFLLTGFASEKWTRAEASNGLDHIDMGLFRSGGSIGGVSFDSATCKSNDTVAICQFVHASIFFSACALLCSLLAVPVLFRRGPFACAGVSAAAGAAAMMAWGLWFSSVGSTSHRSYFLQQTGLALAFNVGYSQIAFVLAGGLHICLALLLGITWIDLPPAAVDEVKVYVRSRWAAVGRLCGRLRCCTLPSLTLGGPHHGGGRSGERLPLLSVHSTDGPASTSRPGGGSAVHPYGVQKRSVQSTM